MAGNNFYLLVLVFVVSFLGLSLLLLLDVEAFLHQIFFGFLPGLIFGFFVYKANLIKIKKYLPFFLFFFLFLCFLTLVPPLGKKMGGAARWLDFKFFTFQPSEVFKLIVVLYLAAFFEKERNVFSFLLLFGICSFVFLLQPHFSNLVIVSIIFLAMFFLQKESLWQFLKTIFLVAILGLTFAFLSPYRVERIFTFLDPYKDPLGSGYQIIQSQIHIGSGRIFGQGWEPHLLHQYLPQSISDTIFAVFAQKTGFLGSSLLLLIFFFIFFLGFRIGAKQKNKFLRLSCQGVSVWLAFQAFFNIGALCGLLPLAGVHLPFMSAGGSAILAEILGVAVILNVGRK